ncbi:UNVERIFIED_CONTAM: hypothetical protein Sangu_2132300 [Sesamum angustifolium]|uniref:Uncharacterized protein n=1 Tax=Sesamum angustifolium TaxID=2727405 RepID=A0AAW2LDI0_9LAMI
MASTIIQCTKTSKFTPANVFVKATPRPVRPAFLRVSRMHQMNGKRVVFAAFSAAGSSGANSEFNPYEVLGVNPLEGFDMVKSAYAKKRKDAERRGDEAAAAQLERAYDKIMMSQLTKRKKGETFGSFRVSKDIKYADKLPVVPWGPRFAKSEVKDIRINMAISAIFDLRRDRLNSLCVVYRIFEKLKAFEPPASLTFTEDGEDEGRMLRMGKRLLRSLALVFGCVAFASLGYTAVLNVIEFAGGYIPVFLFNNQLDSYALQNENEYGKSKMLTFANRYSCHIYFG